MASVAGPFKDTWFILASGPSQNYHDVRKVRDKGTTCAVNNTIFMAPWADVLYAADHHWWREYGARVRSLSCRKLSISPASKNYGATEIVTSGPKGAVGLGRKGVVHRGGNSGYQACNVAYNEGAKEIVLLGFDMTYTFGRRHWHEDHPASKKLGNADGVSTWRENFRMLADDLAQEGVRVVNCTRHTALECFERMALEEYLADRIR